MVLPRSIFGDFGILFGACLGTENVENPALDQQLEVFLFKLAFFLPKYALREHLQMLKNENN